MTKSFINNQQKAIANNTLIGVYIRCQGKDYQCNEHDVIEDFPADAPVILFGKGWRVVDKDKVLCPDCARRYYLLKQL